jgi:hypothetical protein
MRRDRFYGSLILVMASAGGCLLYGCAEATDAAPEEPAAASPEAGASGYGEDDGSVARDDDARALDAGRDASRDATPDAKVRADSGAPGTPCGPVGENESQTCGLCGTQSRVCLAGDAGTDAGQKAGVWSTWGACTGEVSGPGTCDPAATNLGTQACGNCGTRPIVCQPDCRVAQGIVCQNEPVNACTPADTTFTLAQGCSANLGRSQTCGNDCQWGAPSACMAPPPNPNALTVAKTTGTTVSGTFALTKSRTQPMLDTGSCPTTIGSDASPYIYVELYNTDTKAHVVDVWSSKLTIAQDNMMAWYSGPVVPSGSARASCSGAVNDDRSTPRALRPACTGVFAGLVDGDAPTIPAGGAIEVYIAGINATTPAGNFQLNVRTR